MVPFSRGLRIKGEKILALSLALVLVTVVTLPLAGCRASTRGLALEKESVTEEQPPPPIVNPLTGEVVDSEAEIARRALAVKIENDPAARPQSGLVDAELVWEELVEGGVTRFICIYLAHESGMLGPNRSVRPSDIDITYFLEPLLVCSGGAPLIMSMVRSSGMMYLEEDGTHFWRDRNRRAPHNLYTNTEKLRAYLVSRGDVFGKVVQSGLSFYSEEEAQSLLEAIKRDAGGEPDGEETGQGTEAEAESAFSALPSATDIAIAYLASCAVSYRYDVGRNLYLRYMQNKPHTDLVTGAQVAPRNVIVQYVQVTPSGLKDVLGADSPNSQVIGSGKCLVFSGGKVLQGTWSKRSRKEPTIFRDLMGYEIKLFPGQTWIHLIPESIKLTYQ